MSVVETTMMVALVLVMVMYSTGMGVDDSVDGANEIDEGESGEEIDLVVLR